MSYLIIRLYWELVPNLKRDWITSLAVYISSRFWVGEKCNMITKTAIFASDPNITTKKYGLYCE